MALEDMISRRYQDYITIEELVKLIAKEYECSEKDALMVLSDSIKSNSSKGFDGSLEFGQSIYRRERLGPKMIDSFEKNLVLRNLCKDNVSTQEELGFDIPF